MTDPTKSTFAMRIRVAKPPPQEVRCLGRRDFRPRPARRHERAPFVLPAPTRARPLGHADTMSLLEARREARKLIATFIESARKDNGPRAPGRPMDAFAEEFLKRYVRHWKPRTLESNRYLVRNHILPAFGHLIVDAITVEHVKDWFASMADRPAAPIEPCRPCPS